MLPKKEKSILINGAGTVGIRDADILLSLGIPTILSKYNANEKDIKTQELKALLNRHPNRNIELYVGRGSDLEERVNNFKQIFSKCNGPIDKLDFSKISLAIDCTDTKDSRVFNEIYSPNNIPFAINGGGNDRLVKGFYFASVPNTKIQENLSIYKTNNAKIVSCNTHCITTFLGLLKNVLGKDDTLTDKLRDDIIIDFSRRYDDPHKNIKKPPRFVTVEHKPYHVNEVEFLHPETKNKIDTTYSKWPTEYFHNLTITLDMKKPVSEQLIEDIKFEIQTYPRTILEEGPLSHERTIKAAEKARINDGDIPFPIFKIDKSGKHKIRTYALTPQRGIVAPSTADYTLIRTQTIPSIKTWKDAFNYVNQNASWQGETLSHIKESIQDNLAHYEEQVKNK